MAIVIAPRDQKFDKGTLIRVPMPGKPGVYVKMTRAEALARGLLVETKEKKPRRNKSRKPAANKGTAEE